VRIQIAIALITFMLLRLAHQANRLGLSPLAFVRLIRANLMHRRSIAELLDSRPPLRPPQQQIVLDFEPAASRAAQHRRACRADLLTEIAA
jgi:hypothetical protein